MYQINRRGTCSGSGVPESVDSRVTRAPALGNVLVQTRAHGDVSGGLADLRALVRETHALTRYDPKGHTT